MQSRAEGGEHLGTKRIFGVLVSELQRVFQRRHITSTFQQEKNDSNIHTKTASHFFENKAAQRWAVQIKEPNMEEKKNCIAQVVQRSSGGKKF